MSFLHTHNLIPEEEMSNHLVKTISSVPWKNLQIQVTLIFQVSRMRHPIIIHRKTSVPLSELHLSFELSNKQRLLVTFLVHPEAASRHLLRPQLPLLLTATRCRRIEQDLQDLKDPTGHSSSLTSRWSILGFQNPRGLIRCLPASHQFSCMEGSFRGPRIPHPCSVWEKLLYYLTKEVFLLKNLKQRHNIFLCWEVQIWYINHFNGWTTMWSETFPQSQTSPHRMRGTP